MLVFLLVYSALYQSYVINCMQFEFDSNNRTLDVNWQDVSLGAVLDEFALIGQFSMMLVR